MRCGACDVDLNENAALCPLCGSCAQDIAPLIGGVVFQDYPACKNGIRRRRQDGKRPARGGMTFRESLRARLHL